MPRVTAREQARAGAPPLREVARAAEHLLDSTPDADLRGSPQLNGALIAWMQLKERSVDMNEKSDHIMQFFAWSHLPEALQKVSQPFGELADRLVADLPRNPERTVALRKLLEAKDAAVRAALAKDPA